jgi:hypothetical protein
MCLQSFDKDPMESLWTADPIVIGRQFSVVLRSPPLGINVVFVLVQLVVWTFLSNRTLLRMLSFSSLTDFMHPTQFLSGPWAD